LYERVLQCCCCCEGGDCCEGGGVSIREQRSRARSRREGVSENQIAGTTAARLTAVAIAVAIAIATRPFKFHEISVSNTSSSFVSSIHSFAFKRKIHIFFCINLRSLFPKRTVVYRCEKSCVDVDHIGAEVWCSGEPLPEPATP
jgi:hypothetical protein